MSEAMQVPAHIAKRMQERRDGSKASSAIMDAIAGSGPSIPRISIKAAKYRLVEGGVETPVGSTLDVVIVGVNPRVSKAYFDQPYDGTEQRPACSSDDGIRPNADIEDPVSTACATCPNNVLGSKVNPSGAKSKLCSDHRHLAVVAAADPSKVYQLSLAISAMKPLREYFKHLQNYGTVPEEVVTELGFDDSASFPLVTFSKKKFLPEKALATIDQIVESDDVKVAVKLMAPTGAAALPQGEAPVAITAPEPAAPVAEPEPEPAVAEPEAKAKAPESLGELEAALDNLFD